MKMKLYNPSSLVIVLLLILFPVSQISAVSIEKQNLEDPSKWEELHTQYRSQLEKNPEDPKIQKLVTELSTKISNLRYEKAKSLFGATNELDPSIVYLEAALIFNPENKEASDLLDQLREKKKEALELLRTALDFQRDRVYPKAIESIRQALEIYPDSPEILKALKEIEEQSVREEALKLLTAALSFQKDRVYPKAIESIRQAEQLYPDSFEIKRLRREIETEALTAYREKVDFLSKEEEWKKALRLYKELYNLFPEDGQIASLIQDLEKKSFAKDRVTEAENLLSKGELDSSLKLVKESLGFFPDYDKAQILLGKVTTAIAETHVNKGKLFAEEKRWLEAIKEYEEAEKVVPSYTGVEGLRKEAINNVVEFYYNHAIELEMGKKYKEAYLELAEIFKYKRGYKDVEKKIADIRTLWVSDLYKQAMDFKKDASYGNALLRCVACKMLHPEFAGQKDIQNTIVELEEKIRERVSFGIGIFSIKNYSNNPELGGRITNGIFEFLLRKSMDTLKIVDRSSEDDVRYEAQLTGAKLADLEPIVAFIDGAIYPLKIDAKQETVMTEKKIKVGIINGSGLREQESIEGFSMYDASYYNPRDNRALDFRNLYEISKIYSTEQSSENLEFIEEPRYATLKAGTIYIIKTATIGCYLKIKDFTTRHPLFTKEIQVNEIEVDGRVTDTELSEKLIDNLISKAGRELYDRVKNYGLSYYRLAKQADFYGDEISTIERYYDFLRSFTARIYPEQASLTCTYLDNKLVGLVPSEARKLDIKTADIFPIIKQRIGFFKEEKIRAEQYGEKVSMARERIAKKDWHGAINAARQALGARYDDKQAREIIERASLAEKEGILLQAVKTHISEGDLEAAISRANLLLEIDPHNQVAKEMKGKAELNLLPSGFRRQLDSIICAKDSSEMVLIIGKKADSFKRYLVDRYEVTNKQFSKFISETGYEPHGKWEKYYKEGQDNYPVRNITYEDAQAYARWAGKDLPTQREWEYAAKRSGEDNSKLAEGEVKLSKEPMAVGANPLDISSFGCYDMAGNVSEWVKDLMPLSSAKHVLRGGSYRDKLAEQHYTTKIEVSSGRTRPEYGFRCVRQLKEVECLF